MRDFSNLTNYVCERTCTNMYILRWFQILYPSLNTCHEGGGTVCGEACSLKILKVFIKRESMKIDSSTLFKCHCHMIKLYKYNFSYQGELHQVDGAWFWKTNLIKSPLLDQSTDQLKGNYFGCIVAVELSQSL